MALNKKKLSDLKFDNQNINKGSEYGNSLLEKSLQEGGAGRSILIDKNGVIIAGNQTTQKASELGFEEVIIVPTDGKTLVAVQRMDIDINSPEGAKLKILDNTVSKHNYVEDAQVMEIVCEEYDLDPKSLGLSTLELAPPSDDDLTDLSDKIKTEFKIEVVCKDEEQQERTYNKLIEEGYECRLLTL